MMRAPSVPRTSGSQLVAVSTWVERACSTASLSNRFVAPGTTEFSVSTIVPPNEPALNACARPTSAITACTKISDVRNAIDRAWLNPSAARSRRKASAASARSSARRSVSRRSSNPSSGCSGTGLALLIRTPPPTSRDAPGP